VATKVLTVAQAVQAAAVHLQTQVQWVVVVLQPVVKVTMEVKVLVGMATMVGVAVAAVAPMQWVTMH
jgi:hypothetical protein